MVDYLWYRKHVPGAYVDSFGFDLIDEWGRMVPDPKRWPSSNGGKGFSEVARRVHAMGLKFGIHIMRGISTQAFNANTPILDITTVYLLLLSPKKENCICFLLYARKSYIDGILCKLLNQKQDCVDSSLKLYNIIFYIAAEPIVYDLFRARLMKSLEDSGMQRI